MKLLLAVFFIGVAALAQPAPGNLPGGGGGGGVTSIATTGPITGGTITSTGTIACATCATAAAGGSLTTSGAFAITLTATGATTVTLPTSGTLAILGGNTFTGQQIISLNGAASTPPRLMTGTWYSGGSATTTKPQDLIECNSGTTTSTAWNTNGTGLGVNACSGFTGYLLDLQLNGVSKLNVGNGGNIQTSGSVTVGSNGVSGSGVTITSNSLNQPNNVNFTMSFNGTYVALEAGRYDWGGTTASVPAFTTTSQTDPILNLVDGAGGSTAQFAIPFIQSTTGQRYVCVTTTGLLVSSATACVGT